MPDIELQLERSTPESSLRLGPKAGSNGVSDTQVHRLRQSEPTECAQDLARKIVRELSPVLQNAVDSHQSSIGPHFKLNHERSYVFRPIDVAEFTTLAVCSGCDVWSYVESAAAIGATVEQILEELLAPAARRLGDLWETDDCDFLDVTTATHRLQTAVRRLSQNPGIERHGRPRALLAAAPGEAHVLGLAIVKAHFEKFGWSADLAGGDDLEAAVRRHRYALVAFSISCDRFVDALADAATNVRKVSRNRNVFILVGGPIVALDPELAAKIGADAGAATPQEAIVVTRSLLRRGARL